MKHITVQAQKRTFAGNSLRGVIGLYILFKQPDMFSSSIISSPSVCFADKDILSQLVVKSELPKRVYLAFGVQVTLNVGQQQDRESDAKAFAQKIND
ncbi:hypothetical protein [Paraglaciecola sp. 20A4]|uniref:hypothetical protein n=1 Tax=Paraglaciecola sp. 20A4 TaxID=2687288 RepID=UPI00140D45C5|nr:hypothetical protein [Paraglaciecola sp. 20A4]